MKKLNRYIVKQIFIGFLLVTFSLLSILWLTQSLRFVDLITNKGIPIGLFVKLTSLLMPRLFVLLSPICAFVAVLFVYNRMLSDRELVVIKSAGISPWQGAKPALIIGIFLYVINVYTYNYGIPAAEKAFNELEWQIKNDVSHLMFREGEFTELQNGLTVFITTHEKDGSMSGILVNDERNPQNRTTISAEKGRVVYTDKGPKIIMVNGSRPELSKNGNQFSSLAFERYSVDFGLSGNKKSKDTSAREKGFFELLNAQNDPSLSPKDQRRYVVEGHRRIINPFYNIVFALLGCTGLLVGNFNRRGQSRIISVSIIAMVLLQAMDLSFGNLAAKNLGLLPLMYINLLLPFIVCVYLLLFYTPGMFAKRRQPPEIADV